MGIGEALSGHGRAFGVPLPAHASGELIPGHGRLAAAEFLRSTETLVARIEDLYGAKKRGLRRRLQHHARAAQRS